MRVLTVGNMYPPHHLGGYEIAWRGAVERLEASGHQVMVLTTDFVRSDVSADAEEGPGEVRRELRSYWRDHRFPRIGPLARLRLERHNHAILDRILAAWRPDLVCWWAMGGMSLSLLTLPRRDRIPSLGVVCDDWLLYGPRVDGWQRLLRLLGPAVRPIAALGGVDRAVDPSAEVDRWLFLSDTVRTRAAGRWPAVAGSEIAHPGVDGRLFQPAPAREWGWRLLYVGRLDPRKGIDLAIEVLGELPAARLTIDGAGDPAYRERLERLAIARGVRERVELRCSDRAELPAVYAAADLLLFPVLWDEPWGIVPLEAMAVGRPVVATGRGGSGEYLEDGRNCLLFDPERGAGGLASAIDRLASDPRLRDGLIAGGRATASRHLAGAFEDAVVRACEQLDGEER